ncbi:MAG: phosphotransferase [Deltaproteobacteria bacterium]|nr:phosphotransferase [Deltaproteobacteria bacterium]
MADLYYTRNLQEAAARLGATLDLAQMLAGDGSDRKFFRLFGSPTVILLSHPDPPGGLVNENDSYFLIGRHLKSKGVPVPQIYEYSREEGWMLLEDLGDISLETALRSKGKDELLRYWYGQALTILVNMQIQGAEGFDPGWCFDTPNLDKAFLLDRECRYFVEAFLNRYMGFETAFEDLEPDFARLVSQAVSDGVSGFLHRDFQSRNLFIKDGRLRIVDFQGGRLGPLGYDLAALLIDPYMALEPRWEQEFLSHYLKLLRERLAIDPRQFQETYHHLALSRNLQVLGAYGFLTRVKGKDYFARYIPAAVKSLRRRLAERPGEFPRLTKVVEVL